MTELRDNKDIINELLAQRGITTSEDIAEFLSDRPQRTYDPFLMKNMREGVDLILDEIRAGSRICIYGDYDCDGVTSVCILHTVLSQLTQNLTWYIPSRFEEGYGMNLPAIDRLCEDGVDLIITVDCGITSNKEIAYARSLGMRVLVTDHHSVGDELPDCIAIDPKQEGETYPFRQLAGCGVAFKLLQAIQKQEGLSRSIVSEVLDLVATGTVADIVPLKDENRTIVKYGLMKINERSRPGMAALVQSIGLDKDGPHVFTSENISFGLAPRINAAGRMKHAKEAVLLLLAKQQQTELIRHQVTELTSYNTRRKQLQDEAWRKSEALIEQRRAQEHLEEELPIICLRVDGIHEGIAGIAAGKLKESHLRPVILVTPGEDGLLKGTGRSIPGVDLFRLLDGHRELFVRVGGHSKACGFTIGEEEFRTLKPLLEEEVRRMYEADPSILELEGTYDLQLSPGDITVELADALKVLEPFGEENPVPRLLLRDVYIRRPAYMGEGDVHVRFEAVRDGRSAPCVLFQKAQMYRDKLEKAAPVSVIGKVQAKKWNGRRRVQLIVEEIL